MVAMEAIGKGVDLVVANIYALMVGLISASISWVLFAFQSGVKSPGGPYLIVVGPVLIAPLAASMFSKQLGLAWYGLTVIIYTLFVSINDVFFYSSSLYSYISGTTGELMMHLMANFAVGLIIYFFGYVGVMALMTVWGRFV